MKNFLKSPGLFALLFAFAGLVFSGCASTPTSKSTGEVIDDAAITTKVKAAFAKDDIVKAREVSVTTYKGTVQLGGFVDNQDNKERAERIARSVSGVQAVENNIGIKGDR